VRVLNSVPLNQVIVTFGTGTLYECNELTRATVAQLQADNICLAGGADWHQHFVLRLSLIAAPLVEADVDRLAAAILAAWRRVQSRARQPRAEARPAAAAAQQNVTAEVRIGVPTARGTNAAVEPHAADLERCVSGSKVAGK
jgi:hypothetical protein